MNDDQASPVAACGRTHDALIVGAGPAGLALALSLAAMGLRIAVVERQQQSAIAMPRDDGREIALTHQSMRTLRTLGAAAGWSADEIAPIRAARVYNGRSARFLNFQDNRDGGGALGYLVSNHCIRRELYRRARDLAGIELLFDQNIAEFRIGAELAAARTASGWLRAPLLVAADSRYSETRRAMGIAASMHDFGRTMLVFRARHGASHHDTAIEWFDYSRTIATLPLQGDRSSIIVTLPGKEADELTALPQLQQQARVSRWLDGRLGELTLCSAAHRYPLVSAYAERFAGPRFALIGDAAVGMHPVTAHGFNFGLSGQHLLSSAIAAAHRSGGDIGAPWVLEHYARLHRQRTWPLYQATNAIARLYAADTGAARLARQLMISAAGHIGPLKRAIVRELRS